MEWNEEYACFEITVRMRAGFKHRFCFRVNGDITVNSALQSSTNAIGKLTNFIYIPKHTQ